MPLTNPTSYGPRSGRQRGLRSLCIREPPHNKLTSKNQGRVSSIRFTLRILGIDSCIFVRLDLSSNKLEFCHEIMAAHQHGMAVETLRKHVVGNLTLIKS
jgi:hypothetical protein